MKKNNVRKIPALHMSIILLFISGCSGNIKKNNQINISQQTTLSSIDVRVSEKVKKELGDDSVFNAETLKSTIATQLQNASLIDLGSQYQLIITVYDVRYRSSASAVLLGFMAGNDHIYGVATIKDNQGDIVNEFDVDTWFAFGGVGGGVAVIKDSSRMGWLYKRFAELVLEGIVGKT